MPDINSILRHDGRPAKFGAPMGDSDLVPEELEPWPKLYCQKLILVDGDYGADGTYWGGGSGVDSIFCVFDGPKARTVRIYTRAKSREEAMTKVKETYPQATFIRRT